MVVEVVEGVPHRLRHIEKGAPASKAAPGASKHTLGTHPEQGKFYLYVKMLTIRLKK